MTIDLQTGEVVAHLSATTARRLTDEIRDTLTVAYDKLVEAWRGRADLALGYESWDAYCAGEFSEARMLRPTMEQRREIVSAMSSEGMSTRAIGSAIGTHHSTIADDLAGVGNPTPEPDIVDGELIDESETDDGATDSPVADASADEEPQGGSGGETAPSSPKVTGLDGKTYTPPAPKKRAASRSPLPDFARNTGVDLRKLTDRVERIAQDDRLKPNAEQVATHLRSHLTRTVEVCQDLLDQLEEMTGV